jgi:DNA-binding transcriptional MerR regulator
MPDRLQAGIVPTSSGLILNNVTKRLVMAGRVQRLTGLSPDQLREWTRRRGLIKPDAEPCGPGSRARFSWQTVLLLRLAVVLKTSFHIELQAHRAFFAALSQRIENRPFHALRGCALLVQPDTQFDIVPLSDFQAKSTDTLILCLDPHLDALSADFDLIEPVDQFPLFAVAGVGR